MFTLTRNASRDPAHELSTLERRISRFFNDAFGGLDWQYSGSALAAWVPPVDVLEEADSMRILAELPGVRPEHVKISVEGNERTFTLPATVDASNIKAAYEHEVLTITLPKVEQAKPRQIHAEVRKS